MSSSYLPVLGGLQEAVSQLAEAFRGAGHDVIVVTSRYPRNLKRNETINGIPVTRMFFTGFHLESPDPYVVVKFIAGLMISAVNFLRLLNLLKKRKPDVVNIHFLGSQAPYAMLASRFLGIQCVMSLHGDDVEGLPHRSKIGRLLFEKILTAAGHVTACSGYLLGEAKKMVPAIGTKSTVIHNGVRPEEFLNVLPYAHTEPYILAAGRFVHKKGFDILLRAYRTALGKGLKSDLILAGDGVEKQKLLTLAVDLGLSFAEKETNRVWIGDGSDASTSRVVFWGRAGRAEMKSLMKGCSLCVIPSREEAFGIVALEAFASGKSVVATKVGGLPEIVHEGQNGYLVAPDDAEGLAERILSAMQDGKSDVSPNFEVNTWESAAKRYLAAYENICR